MLDREKDFQIMNRDSKPIESIQSIDLQKSPVWEFVNRDRLGETVVRPIKRIPVRGLTGRVAGTKVSLSNGQKVWALLGNIVADNPKLTEHFITLSVEYNGKWFTLARYHDIDYSEHGPVELAKFLGLAVGDVFPVSYDITAFCKGNAEALRGLIHKEPKKKLTWAEIIALSVS